jgi:DNA-binding CsgD family transcriptional regulator
MSVNLERENKNLLARIAELEATRLERVKELSCLYQLTCLFDKYESSVDEVLKRAVELIPPAWQYPNIARASITFKDKQFFNKTFQKSRWRQSAMIYVNKKKAGSVNVYYLEKQPVCGEGPFLKEERSLVNAIAQEIGRFIERVEALASLYDSKRTLLQKNQELERKNITLTELIAQFELEKHHLEDKVLANAQNILLPLLERLAKKNVESQYIDLMRRAVNCLTGDFGRRITNARVCLSPREVEMANLIKQGLSSKKIAEMLALSFQTVESYRKNIRRKLGLTRGKANLVEYLKQL